MNTGTKKRNPLTKHARMRQRPSTRKKIVSLYREWDALDPIARGERLRELTDIGCSRRGLAEELGISATSVRFHLDMIELSPAKQQEVKAGSSAKRAFDALQKQREIQARVERIREERLTAAISDELASHVARFCTEPHPYGRDKTPVVLCDGDIEPFFVDLDRALEMRLRGYAPMPPPAPKHLNFITICQKLEPHLDDSVLWFSWLTEWVARVMLSVAPDAIIRDAVRKKLPALLTVILRPPIVPSNRYFQASR